MHELRVDGSLPSGTKLRSSRYLNNLIEQDHRGVKQRIAVMLGFKETRRHHDRRYRADASHSQRTVPTGPAGCTRSNCAFGLERRDRSLKSRFDAEGCICFCGLFAPEPGSLRCCGRTPSRCCGCHSAACHSSRERGSDESARRAYCDDCPVWSDRLAAAIGLQSRRIESDLLLRGAD